MSDRLFARSELKCLAGVLVASLLMTAAGCGSKTASVTGVVRYRNQTLPTGTVTFFNADKQIVGSAAIKDGKYAMDNLPIGSVAVSVTVPNVPWNALQAEPAEGTPGEVPEIIPIPIPYGNPETSNLTYKVTAGEQDHPIDLQ